MEIGQEGAFFIPPIMHLLAVPDERNYYEIGRIINFGAAFH